MSLRALTMTLMISAWASATPAFALPGMLDPTFGQGGKVVALQNMIDTGGNGIPSAISAKLQQDGRILVAASFGTFGVGRFLSNGALDSTQPSGAAARSCSHCPTTTSPRLLGKPTAESFAD